MIINSTYGPAEWSTKIKILEYWISLYEILSNCQRSIINSKIWATVKPAKASIDRPLSTSTLSTIATNPNTILIKYKPLLSIAQNPSNKFTAN